MKFSDAEHQGRYKRAISDKTACSVAAVADYKFYQHMGQSNNFTTANYIVSLTVTLNVVGASITQW